MAIKVAVENEAAMNTRRSVASSRRRGITAQRIESATNEKMIVVKESASPKAPDIRSGIRVSKAKPAIVRRRRVDGAGKEVPCIRGHDSVGNAYLS